MRRILWTTIMAGACGAGLLVLGGAGPDDPPAKRTAAEPRRDRQDAGPEFDPAVAKARLSRRLEEVEREAARLREAVARLEKGDPVKDVMTDARTQLAERFRERVEERRTGERRGPDRANRPDNRPGNGAGNGPDTKPGQDADAGRDAKSEPKGERDGRPGAGPWTGPGRGPMTAEDRDHAIRRFRENFPELGERYKSMIDADPEGAAQMIHRMSPRFQEAIELRERDPEMFKLKGQELQANIDVMIAIRRLMKTRSGEGGPDADPAHPRESAELAAVKDAIAAQFDARMKVQAREIEALAKRLESLRGDHASKIENREMIIQERLHRAQEMEPVIEPKRRK